MKYFRRVIPYLSPYAKAAVFSLALLVFGAIFGLLSPWPLKILVDHVLDQKQLPGFLAFLKPLMEHRVALLVVAVAGGVAITALQNLFKVLEKYVNTNIEQGMVLDFRSDLFDHAQRLSFTFHDRRRTGKVIFAINNLGGAIAKLVMVIPGLSQSLLTLLGMFCIVLMIDWELALISLAIVPFLYWSVGYYMSHITQHVRRVRGMEAEMLSMIHESMSMLRVIVAFGREADEHRRFRDHGEKTVSERVKVTVRQTVFTLGVNTTTAAGTALVLGFGGWHVIQGRLTIGELLVVMSYIAAVYKPLETVSTTVGSLQEVYVGLEGAFNLLDTENDLKEKPEARAIGRAQGHVEFDGVHFSYNEAEDILNDVSFQVRPGMIVGIVGATGSGKTTLVSLMPRFYDPRAGRILIDGHDIQDLTLESLREQFSIVMQEPLLFSASIAENIRYGRPDAAESEIIAAAEAANAHSFIMRKQKGYDTPLGERGAKLSGGERQRIAIARAFLRDAPILILDEPTSAVDSKTESVILDALDQLVVGRTTFMIAHRLSTIRHADLILVLQQGRIVQEGSHEELMSRQGLYRQLYNRQARQSARNRVHGKNEYGGLGQSLLMTRKQ